MFSALKFRFYIFVQWEWFMPFCSDDFPGQYKRLCKALLTSLPHSLLQQNRPSLTRRAHSIFGSLFSLEDHSFILYSFLLDQLVPETSSWMLYSCFNIRNCILPFVRLTVQGYLCKLLISRHRICGAPFASGRNGGRLFGGATQAISAIMAFDPKLIPLLTTLTLKFFGTHQYSRPFICLSPFLM